jgi:ferredoxin-NADP reductase
MINEPVSDVTFERPVRLKVIRIAMEADAVVSLELGNVDGRPLPAWQPGAHVDLLLANGLVRQYSLCGSCADRHIWQVAVLHAPSSRGGSSFIHQNIGVGEEILVTGLRNNFSLVEANRYLFVAGGIGITPILPMLESATLTGKSWRLVYGGRSRRSMAFLDRIKRYDPRNVELLPQDEFGQIEVRSLLSELEPATPVYCCGPAGLIDAVEDACRLSPPIELYRERFVASDRGNEMEDGSFEVRLALSGKVIHVPAEQSLLSALEDAGCKITNSCRAGICGTCLLKVLDGTPDHRDDLLDDVQREGGAMILPCVSRSKSRHLVLEI